MIARNQIVQLVFSSVMLCVSSGVFAADQPLSDNVQLNAVTDDTAEEMLGLTVTGSQELPKSLIIIPWKDPQPGELLDKNFESLVDQEEKSLDRDVYLRILAYERVKSRP